MHATQVFARYGAGFSERELPAKVLHHAAQHGLVDLSTS